MDEFEQRQLNMYQNSKNPKEVFDVDIDLDKQEELSDNTITVDKSVVKKKKHKHTEQNHDKPGNGERPTHAQGGRELIPSGDSMPLVQEKKKKIKRKARSLISKADMDAEAQNQLDKLNQSVEAPVKLDLEVENLFNQLANSIQDLIQYVTKIRKQEEIEQLELWNEFLLFETLMLKKCFEIQSSKFLQDIKSTKAELRAEKIKDHCSKYIIKAIQSLRITKDEQDVLGNPTIHVFTLCIKVYDQIAVVNNKVTELRDSLKVLSLLECLQTQIVTFMVEQVM
ncbi:Hypothetical_protein [Hexamita inflata]|uniref:Hypothetical_protein n=1 Tax=Hexamita inflata TaxID=28002 RepID=A0AA86R869_9EUKA|nr:Hypothetical protein HINF_LOCUS55657 [Hexamita inflata]